MPSKSAVLLLFGNDELRMPTRADNGAKVQSQKEKVIQRKLQHDNN